jgi:acetyl esterase/lipase
MNENAGRILCALLALCSPGATVAQESVPPPQPLTIEGAVTHVYKSVDGAELRLHVFNPPNHSPSARRPAILFFFGGGWNGGTVVQFVPQAKHLAERGMVAIVADYRVFRRHKTTPFESMADARSAMRWVRSRPNELGIDPDRIAAGGGSSGGHLALSTAVFGGVDEPGGARGISARPDALVLFNPPVDTSTIAQFGDRGKEASPLHHLDRNLPPTIIFHGKEDKTIPMQAWNGFAPRLGNSRGDASSLDTTARLTGSSIRESKTGSVPRNVDGSGSVSDGPRLSDGADEVAVVVEER